MNSESEKGRDQVGKNTENITGTKPRPSTARKYWWENVCVVGMEYWREMMKGPFDHSTPLNVCCSVDF